MATVIIICHAAAGDAAAQRLMIKWVFLAGSGC